MASLSAFSMATPIRTPHTKTTFFSPLPIKPQWDAVMGQKPSSCRPVKVQASLKEKAVTGLTAALTASMVVPEVAEAAELAPSLKNFLLSIVAGGVVLTAILGAVIAVSNFDPLNCQQM